MGNAYSISQLNPEQYPAIQISGKHCFSDCGTTTFPFEEKPPELRDSVLWDQFGKAIDEQLPYLNRFLFPLSLTYTVLFFGFILSIIFLAQDDGSPYIGLAIFPLGMLLLCGLVLIINKNQSVDKAISSICEEFNPRFAQHGYSIEYRTKWTGFCKPKGAKPLRLLVFRPIKAFPEP